MNEILNSFSPPPAVQSLIPLFNDLGYKKTPSADEVSEVTTGSNSLGNYHSVILFNKVRLTAYGNTNGYTGYCYVYKLASNIALPRTTGSGNYWQTKNDGSAAKVEIEFLDSNKSISKYSIQRCYNNSYYFNNCTFSGWNNKTNSYELLNTTGNPPLNTTQYYTIKEYTSNKFLFNFTSVVKAVIIARIELFGY